jgi:hypothetical protein
MKFDEKKVKEQDDQIKSAKRGTVKPKETKKKIERENIPVSTKKSLPAHGVPTKAPTKRKKLDPPPEV